MIALPQEQDPASLSRLHDIVAPSPISFWPPTPGWWLLIGIVLAIAGALAWNARQKHRRGAYRRAALRELAALDEKLLGLPALLKRTARTGFPRTAVASLSGDAWLRFLDRTGATTEFSSGPGRAIVDIAYRRGALRDVEVPALLAVVERWIRHHHVAAVGERT